MVEINITVSSVYEVPAVRLSPVISAIVRFSSQMRVSVSAFSAMDSISALDKLHKRGVLSDDYVQDQDTITNDLWAKINTQIIKKVSEREEDDRNHYGKMRATIERRIRGRQ